MNSSITALDNKQHAIWLDIIASNYPDGVDHTIKDIYFHGWDHVVFVLKNDTAFRFVRRKEDTIRLVREVQFCSQFRKISPIPIPEYLLNQDKKTNIVFVMYPFIIGKKLSVDDYILLPKNYKQEIAYQLGNFLRILHLYPQTHGENMHLPNPTKNQYHWKDWFAKTLPIIKPYIDHAHLKQILNFRDVFLKKTDPTLFKKCIIHADMGPEHIIVNEKCQHIEGIIDFTEIQIGDPAIDFAPLVDYGEECIQSICNYYQIENQKIFLERSVLYRKRIYIHNLHHSICINDKDMIKKQKEQLYLHIND